MDSPDPEKAGFLLQAWHFVVALVGGVFAWLGVDTMGRIKALETTRLTKEDFKEHAKQVRHDLRDDLSVINNNIERGRLELRGDILTILERQRVLGEVIAQIKGQMK